MSIKATDKYVGPQEVTQEEVYSQRYSVVSNSKYATAEFTVTRTGDMSKPLTVCYSLGGTAVNGTDYRYLPGYVTIPAGQKSATFLVYPTATTPNASDKTITATLTSNVAYHLSPTSSQNSDTATVTGNRLKDYWSFNETSGTTVTDSGSNGLNGTIYNSPTRGPGYVGNGLTFNGTNQYVQVPYNAAMNYTTSDPFTISAWVKLADAVDLNALKTHYYPVFNTGGVDIELTDQSDYYGLNTYIREADGTQIAFHDQSDYSTTLLDHGWHHVVFVRDDIGIGRMYLDGQQIRMWPLMDYPASARSLPLYIGYSQATGGYFNGSIDEVKVYGRALGNSEIASMVGRNFPSSLKAFWRFDEGSGGSTSTYDTDYDGIGDTGTLTNTPTRITGRIGGALQFNGSNQYVSVANSTDLNITGNKLTLATWAKSGTANWNAAQTFISKRNAYILGPVDNTSKSVQFQVYTTAWQTVSFTPAFDITQWHFYAGTYDGAKLRLYVDGALVNTVSCTGNLASDTGTLTLGRDDGQNRYLNGTLDEARVYNTALVGPEIQGLYNLAGLSVTNVTHGTVQNYAFTTSAQQYSDQAGNFTTIPAKYLGSTYIQTANADRTSTGTQFMQLTVNQPAVVYVLFDDAVISSGHKPAWLTNQFADTNDNVVSNGHTFSVFAMTVPAGTTWLGGNTDDGLDHGFMYTVLLRPVA